MKQPTENEPGSTASRRAEPAGGHDLLVVEVEQLRTRLVEAEKERDKWKDYSRKATTENETLKIKQSEFVPRGVWLSACERADAAETRATEAERLHRIEAGYAKSAIAAMEKAVRSDDMSWCELFLAGKEQP